MSHPSTTSTTGPFLCVITDGVPGGVFHWWQVDTHEQAVTSVRDAVARKHLSCVDGRIHLLTADHQEPLESWVNQGDQSVAR